MGPAHMHHRTTSCLVVLAALWICAGCASVEPVVSASRATLAQQSLEAYLQQAVGESQQGLNDKARLTLREAAMAYPAAKEPWLRLAEDYFRQSDYGNAILAAQEVVQRDNKNPVAQSVLAVSGLRVSAQALGELRDRNRFEVGSKGEAVELTRQMRAHLGEPVLVPLKSGAEPSAETNAATQPTTPARARPSPAAAARAPRPPRDEPVALDPAAAVKPVVSNPAPSSTARPAAARAPQPTKPASAPRSNPFTVLN